MSAANLERRHVEGLDGIAHALRLPAGTDARRIRRWIRKCGLPATLIEGRYFADREQLEAWWAKFRVLAVAGGGR